MSAELGVALVGAGEIGELRARAVARAPGLRLLTVADIRSDAARALAERFGARPSTDPVAAATAPDVDLVLVSTPPDRHETIALPAIEAGKHVLCEKPLAHRIEVAERMCQAADARGVRLATGFNHRYFLAMRFARRLVDEGRLGEVLSVRSFAGHPGGEELAHPWVRNAAVTGGGALVDNGIHVLDLTRYFFGEVNRAQGYVSNLVGPRPGDEPGVTGPEDNALALFRDADDRLATVHATWTEWRGYRFWVEVLGRRGYVRAHYPPMKVEWGLTPTPGKRTRRRWQLFPMYQIRERWHGWQWTIVDTFVRELSDFSATIRGQITADRSQGASGHDGLRAMQMAQAIYRSSREGIEVRL